MTDMPETWYAEYRRKVESKELDVPELLPCPFCGAAPQRMIRVPKERRYYTVCDACGCGGPIGTTPAHGVEMWNAAGGKPRP
jgi:Lar family restriction alleviation protein